MIGPERSPYVGSSRSNVDAVNRHQVDEVPRADDPPEAPPEAPLVLTEEEALPTAVTPAAPSQEVVSAAERPPPDDRNQSSSATQMVPEETVGAPAPAQLLVSNSTTPQGLHAFTGAHAITGRHLDLAVAGGDMTRVVERHSHTHFHFSPQWILGKAL